MVGYSLFVEWEFKAGESKFYWDGILYIVAWVCRNNQSHEY